jgi:cytochrome c biogenesis protein CcmG/thiol:disulfide interchange protein DsbE
MKRGTALAVIGVVAAFVLIEIFSGSSGTTAGKPAPPLPPTALRGKPVTLSQLRGKPALINFWASWCEPCRKEAPELQRFSRSLHGEAALVGVDYTDDAPSARAFASKAGWRYPLLRDPNGTYGDRYGLNGLPATAVLDAKGKIVTVLKGPQTAATLRSALDNARS